MMNQRKVRAGVWILLAVVILFFLIAGRLRGQVAGKQLPYSFESGMTTTEVGGATKVNVDFTVAIRRVAPPAKPGPVDPALGSNVWASDGNFLYLPAPAQAGGYVWARAALVTSW